MAKKKREKKLHLWHPSPWDGKPGFGPAVLRFLFNIIGPADPPCPACGQAMDLHTITRGGPGKATHMICPKVPS